MNRSQELEDERVPDPRAWKVHSDAPITGWRLIAIWAVIMVGPWLLIGWAAHRWLF